MFSLVGGYIKVCIQLFSDTTFNTLLVPIYLSDILDGPDSKTGTAVRVCSPQRLLLFDVMRKVGLVHRVVIFQAMEEKSDCVSEIHGKKILAFSLLLSNLEWDSGVCRHQFCHKVCLVLGILLGALSTKGWKACDDRDIFQSYYSEVLGGKRCMLLYTPVLFSCSPLLWLQHKYNLILVLKRKTLRFASALNFVFDFEKGSRKREEETCSFYSWWLLVSRSSQTSTVLGCYSNSANLKPAEIQLWPYKYSLWGGWWAFFVSFCLLVSDLHGQQKSRLVLHQLGKSSRGSYKRNQLGRMTFGKIAIEGRVE